MINRNNKKLLDEYIHYRAVKDRIDPKSVRLERSLGNHYLQWSGELDFHNAPNASIHFVDYVQDLTSPYGAPVSMEYKRKLVSSARRFFEWLSINKKGFRQVTLSWLRTFKFRVYQQEFDDNDTISEEEIQIIASLPVDSLIEERVQAGACFLFLSAMRISAFVSMPIKAVKLDVLEIQQSPALGMRTKNKKSAKTHLINIAPIFSRVQSWDNKIRAVLSPDGFWFSPISPITGNIDPTVTSIGENRPSIFRKNLRKWLSKHDVTLHSPHDFRRGYASYMWDRAKNNGETMAITQNMMQDNVTTNAMYAKKRNARVKNLIHQISRRATTESLDQDLPISLEDVHNQLKNIEQLLRSKSE